MSDKRFLKDLIELGCGQRVAMKGIRTLPEELIYGVTLYRNPRGYTEVLFDSYESSTTVRTSDLISVAPPNPGTRVADALDCSSAIARIDPFEPHPNV